MTTIDFNLPTMPASHAELGIGIVGSGGIIRQAHLPAYKLAGFTVAAIAARNPETRQQAVDQFGIPAQFGDWRALITRDDVHVLDIGILGEGRLDIVRAAADAGKHLLIQKPLANSLDEARQMVEIAEQAGILLAVNQNARWAPPYRAALSAIQQGLIGDVYDIVHTMRNSQGVAEWWTSGWGAQEPRFQIVQYMVHYLDIVRMWLGTEPETVLAKTARQEFHKPKGELMADVLLRFPGNVNALVSDRNTCWQGEPVSVGFFIEGTEGMIEGDISANTITVRGSRFAEPVTATLPGSWFPEGFAHTMGDLLNAVATGAPLNAAGRDNLGTLAIVEAAYLSASEGRVVTMPTPTPTPAR